MLYTKKTNEEIKDIEETIIDPVFGGRDLLRPAPKFKLPKEEKVRTIDMFPPAEQALCELHKLSGHSSWVFLSKNRKKPYVNPYGPSRLWNQVLERCADVKKARFYNTRHSFTTNMLSRNMNPEWLIQQLGHESIVITRNSYEGKIEPNYDNMPKVVF